MLEKGEVRRADLVKVVDYDPNGPLALTCQVAESDGGALVEQSDLCFGAQAAALGQSAPDLVGVDLRLESRMVRILELLLRRDQQLGDHLFADDRGLDSRRPGSDPESHAVLSGDRLPDQP